MNVSSFVHIIEYDIMYGQENKMYFATLNFNVQNKIHK